ncbi:uncharacterized protein LOC112552451 [Pogonomyrmex barbatus]|uniref:Uncharacterized protein LOC112552451 n=1 Tax=Pogonomyrmex barbatus TaxID=144034 RepID=A0A8N1S418_9HYME|nr:uncharacterized protein LOC112552451 [Pogonomyrmex barbatus]
MDRSENTWQTYKYGTCLCFSGMGRRKFRISVCAISASPEAGDAPGIMSARRKYSAISGSEDFKNAFLSRQDKNPIARYASTVLLDSINVTKDYVPDEFAVVQDDTIRKSSNIENEVDYCGFSYYRTNKSDGFQDAVLVKDVGITCNLLNKNAIEPDISISGVESYLVRQLKLEYNELSSITRKLNAYTKDILCNLASKCKRREQVRENLHVASKHVMASQCTDEAGNPNLKLRFRNDIKKKCGSLDVDLNSIKKEIVKEKNMVICITIIKSFNIFSIYFINKNFFAEDSNMGKRMDFDKAFAKVFLELSSKCSGVLLRNYLMTKREKVFSNTSNACLHKPEHFSPSNRLCKNYRTDKSREFFYTNEYNPLVFTNWREVSKRRNYKSKSAFTANTSGKSRHTVSHI